MFEGAWGRREGDLRDVERQHDERQRDKVRDDERRASTKRASGRSLRCFRAAVRSAARWLARDAGQQVLVGTNRPADPADVNLDIPRTEALLKAGALQSAIFNSANFSSIATDAKGRHPDLQRRRRADARLRGRRGDEQDHAGRHLRSAGGDRARQGVERRARDPDRAGVRGAGLQGLARDRGHLRADLHPQGRQPVPGGRVGHRAARRAGRHHRLPADRHRQHRAQAGRRGAARSSTSGCATSTSTRARSSNRTSTR